MRLKIIFISFFLLSGSTLKSQSKWSLKSYDHKNQEGQTLKIYAENGLISITALKPNVIKVNYLKEEKPIEDAVINEVTFVRITQNLDDIFMGTDSLLIVINKLDFSIRFEKHNQDLYTLNEKASSTWECTDLIFSLHPNELLYDSKYGILKKGRNKGLLPVLFYSSNHYGIYIPKLKYTCLNQDAEQKRINFVIKSDDMSYYFFSGDKEKVWANYQLISDD